MAQVDVSLLVPGASGDGWSVNTGGIIRLTIDKGAQIELINGEVGIIVVNNGTILGGIFNGNVSNRDGATISDGTFNGGVSNIEGATISGGTFNSRVNNDDRSTISGGEFYAEVYNDGAIKNLIAKNGFSLSGGQKAEKITIVDNGVNINKASFDNINKIEVEKKCQSDILWCKRR